MDSNTEDLLSGTTSPDSAGSPVIEEPPNVTEKLLSGTTSLGPAGPAVIEESPDIKAATIVERALVSQPALLKAFREMWAARAFRKDPKILIALAAKDAQALQAFIALCERTPIVPADQTSITSKDRGIVETVPLGDLLAGTKANPPTTAPPDYLLRPGARIAVADIAAEATYRRPNQWRILAEIYSELGHTYHARAAYPEAAQAFLDAIRSDPASADLHLYLGQTRERQERFHDAIRAYLEAIKKHPGYAAQLLPSAYQALARIPDGARVIATWLEKEWVPAIDYTMIHAEAAAAISRFLASAALYRDDYGPAIEHFTYVLSVQPDDLFALEWLGEALWHQRRVEEAHATLIRAVSRADQVGTVEERASTRLKLSRVLLNLGSHHEALKVVEQALALQPVRTTDLLVGLAECYYALHNPHEALQAAKSALAQDASLVDALAVYAAALYDLEQYQPAGQAADAVLKLVPNYLLALKVKAQTLLSGTLPAPDSAAQDQAIRLLQRYIRRRPADMEIQRLLVRTLRESKRPAAEVVVALQAALGHASADERPAILIELAEAALQQDSTNPQIDVVQTLDEAIRLDPKLRTAHWWQLYGDAQQRVGQLAGALESYRQGLAVAPTDLALQERHAVLLLKQEDLPTALEAWQAIARNQPDRGDARLYIAQILRRLGDLQGALDAVRLALDKQLEGDLEFQAHDLRCTILEQLDRPNAEIAEAYLNAGQRRYYKNMVPEAIALFKHARRLDRSNVAIYWFLADALMIASFMPEPPYVNRRKIELSCAVWEVGSAIAAPDDTYAWAYLTRAQICERFTFLPKYDPYVERWKAVVYIECGLVARSWDVNFWVELAGRHRNLENESNALQAVTKALSLDEQNATALEAQVGIFANIGRFDDALAIIQKRGELAPNEWMNGVKSYVLMHLGDYSQAIDLLSAYFAATPKDLWSLSVRADCYRLNNELQKAREDYYSIWQQRDNSAHQASDNISMFGYAAYYLGALKVSLDTKLIREAIARWKQLRKQPTEASNAYVNLGLCHLILAAQQFSQRRLRTGTRYLELGIDRAINVRMLDELKLDLGFLEKVSAAWSPSAELGEVLVGVRERIEKRRRKVEQPPSPAEELRHITVEPGSWAYVGVQAGRARLLAEENEWQPAAAIYQRLLAITLASDPNANTSERRPSLSQPSFPEARDGMLKCMDGLRSLGQGHLRAGATEQADKVLRQAQTIAGSMLEDTQAQAELAILRSCASLLLQRRGAGRGHLLSAFHLYKKLGEDAPGKRVGEATRAVLVGGDQHYLLLSEWQALVEDADTPKAARAALKEAQRVVEPQAIDALQEAGDRALREEQPANAATQFDHALVLVDALDELAPRRFGLLARRGLAAFADNEHAGTRDFFIAALAVAPVSSADPGTILADTLRPLLSGAAQYWALSDELAAWAAEPSTDNGLRGILTTARHGLATYFDTIQKATDTSLFIPIVTPIVFEVSDALVPFVDSRQDEGKFLYEMIPAMRERIKAEMGVLVTGVRARGNPSLPPGSYEIQIDEVPKSRAAASLGYRYFDGPPATIRELPDGPHGFEAVHPVTGAPGYWLPEHLGDQIGDVGLITLSTAEFLIAQIEAVLRRNLVSFLSVQETETLLDEWGQLESGKERVAAALPSSRARHRFTWLLRALLAERVPVRDWQALLAVAAELDIVAAPLSAMLRSARLRLLAQLPGNQPGAAHIELPAEYERTLLGYENGQPFFAAGPVEKLAFLNWLRQEMKPADLNAALVTASPDLRPLLRHLVEPEFPELPVLAREELLAASSTDASFPVSDVPADLQLGAEQL